MFNAVTFISLYGLKTWESLTSPNCVFLQLSVINEVGACHLMHNEREIKDSTKKSLAFLCYFNKK